jgi:hypothetical protein
MEASTPNPSSVQVTRGGPEWDAARDAYDVAEDARERERHARAALANMAGKHPNATVIPRPTAVAPTDPGSAPAAG